MYDLTSGLSRNTAIAVENNYKQGVPVWLYHVISENCFHTDLGNYHTYGLQVTGTDFLEILHDVSVCKETVVWMAKLFNQYQLSPVHFQDAVEDLLP